MIVNYPPRNFIRIRYTIVYYPPRNFIRIIRIKYTTIVVYYPPRNFIGVYGCMYVWMDVSKKVWVETRWDPSPKNGASMAL